MLRQFLFKRRKILKGLYKTYVDGARQSYEAGDWWDDTFFTKGVSDRKTISPVKDILTSAYHYASVELLILKHLRNTRFALESASVCDLGSGSGHWIDFYLSIGASRCSGIDISTKSTEFLAEKYAGETRVTVHHGRILDVLSASQEAFDVVNAIGVMFHIVDDNEWIETIRHVSERLKPAGLFVVGGHFGWLDDLNVQFDAQNAVNKRLHSASRWKKSLKNAGFEKIKIYRNRAYLHIDDSLPENNVLIATKRPEQNHSG